MQDLKAFNDNHGTAILLIGPAGGGKTVLGCRLFPKTYVIVADLNFSSGQRYLTKINETSNVIGFDMVAVDEAGKPVPVSLRYARMFKLLCDAIKDPNIGAIFVDSVTLVEDYIKAKICGATSGDTIKLEGFPQWGLYLVTWKSLINQLRESGKKIIFSAHEEHELDKLTGIAKYKIMVDGKIQSKFPGLFSDVWRCEVEENLGKHTWVVRTLGNTSHELKNNFDLPAKLSADELVKKMREVVK